MFLGTMTLDVLHHVLCPCCSIYQEAVEIRKAREECAEQMRKRNRKKVKEAKKGRDNDAYEIHDTEKGLNNNDETEEGVAELDIVRA